MMKLAYFKFSEVDKMNELLSKTRIASGAKPYVSQQGEFIIPYEDGLPPTNGQLAMQLAEIRNGYIQEVELIKESIAYSTVRFERNKQTIESIPVGSKVYGDKQAKTQLEKENENYKSLITMNSEELERKLLNIELLETRIKELQA